VVLLKLEERNVKRLFISELQNGLTQKEIAEKVGTSQPHVSSWLSGQRIPSSKNLMKLCKVIEKTPLEFCILVDNIKYS
jgi:transcriptional regulator with XRE-family HTH domain